MEFPCIEKEDNYVEKETVFRISKSFDKLSYQTIFNFESERKGEQ